MTVRRAFVALVAVVIGATALCAALPISQVCAEGASCRLLVLMYHNVISAGTPNRYEISARELERDFRYIKEMGYVSFTPKALKKAVEERALPAKAVMLSFDDGFYNYNRILPGLLEKYDLNCVVNVVGEFAKFNKNSDAVERYQYMDYEDMAELFAYGRIEIGNHTFALHHNRKNDVGVKMRAGETEQEYRKRLVEDCEQMEQALKKVGIVTTCYAYPYGLYNAVSESVVKSRGYSVSLTCESRVNTVTADPSRLYRLGRFNRSGVGPSAEQILKKYLP